MSLLNQADKNAIASQIAAVFGTLVQTPEVDVASVISQETAFAKEKVDSGQWTQRRAQKHIEFSVKAAASMYASRRELRQRTTKVAMMNLMNTLGGIINTKIGFALIPLPS